MDAIFLGFVLVIFFERCGAATFIWNGNGADANWSDATNWTGGAAPVNNGTASIILAGSNQLFPNVDVPWDVGSITFSNNAGAFFLAGSALNIRSGGITNNSATTQSISNAIVLATNQTWSATAGILILKGDVNAASNLTVNGSFNSFIRGNISGAGGLIKLGTGTNFLSGTNSYLGNTTVSVGVLNMQNSFALGGTNASVTVVSGATLQLQGGISVINQNLILNGAGVSTLGALRSLTNNNSWNGPVTLASAATIGCDTNSLTLNGGGVSISNFLATFTGGGNFTVNSSIGNGTNGLTKSGAGTLTLTASNSYGGLTTVSAGVLNIQNSSALGSTNLGTTVASGAALQLQGNVNIVGENLSINGTGIANGGALRNVGGSNSWNSLITLAATSTIGADAGTLNLFANITNGANTLTFTNAGTIIFYGGLGSGSGGLTKIGAGTLVLGGTNNFTGATTVSGGLLQFAAPTSLPNVTAITINTNAFMDFNGFSQSILSLSGSGSLLLGGGALTVSNTAATTFSGPISGAGNLTKLGAAIFTLSGLNTFAGSIAIYGGAISVKVDNNLGAATNSIALDNGTLTTSAAFGSSRAIILGAAGGTLNLGGDFTLTNSISGPGALIKIGSKNFIPLTASSYLGGTTLGAGTITMDSDSELGDASGAFTFSTNATLTTTASFSSSRNFFLNAASSTYSAGTGFTNTLNGVISGNGAFTQSGSGTMVLGGNNTFTNLFTIAAGTVRLAGNERLSDLVPVLIAKTTAILDLNNFNETIGSLASSAAGKVTLGNGFLTAGGNNFSRTNSSVISGNGGFTKTGTGTLLFTGANTYTNTTTIAAGTLQLGASERIANNSPLVISNGATFNLTWNGTNYSETISSLSGAGNITLGTTLTAGNSGTANFSGTISGAGAFTKAGSGTQIFSGTNSYSGATTVSGGNLQVTGVSTNSAVSISSLATLSGTGLVGTVAVNSGATNSPGPGAPGTLNSGMETWAGGGNYFFEINNATGVKGVNWDWLNLSGALNITANSGSKFNLRIVSLTPANVAGQATNFDNTITYIWTIATAAGGISGFSAASFNLITNGFQNPFGAGSFSVSQSGNDLNLIFTTASLAVVKSVQNGTFASSGAGTNSLTLGAGVNPTNSFLIFSSRHNSTVPGGSMIRGRLVSSNNVEFVRVTSEASTMNVQWSVVEYSAGVRVQRGEINQTSTNINVPLTAVSSTNQAFVLWSKTPDISETTFTDSDPVVGDLITTSNLQFRVTAAPSAAPLIWWQVVEFQHPASINVQRGSVTNLTGTNLTATATLTSPVDPNATFVLTGYRTSGSGTSIGARLLRAQLVSATTINFDRSISGAPDDLAEISWQAIQLKDGSLVQSGSANFPAGVAQTNLILATSLNTNRTIAFATMQPAGGANGGRSSSTGGVLGVGSATLAMTSLSQLTLDRNNTATNTDIGWSVVGLGPSSILAPATGGAAISADAKGVAYTNLTGPIYSEILSGSVSTGTIILNAPTGFIFDTNAVQPNVLIARVGGSGESSLNTDGVASGTVVPMTTVTTTNLTLTITNASNGGVTCSLTWQNLRVRPTAGTPLASGNITSSGTAVLQGVTTNSTSWGFLNEVIGAATKLALVTTPSSTAVAGVDFAQQPVIQVQDQFGNLRNADNVTVVIVTNTGTSIVEGVKNIMVSGGVATFSGLDYTVAETVKLGFAAPGLTGAVSENIVVSPAAASQLTLLTQPSPTATAGIKFSAQPLVRVEDAFGNLRTSDNSTVVSADINSGSDDLFGTTNITVSGGVATFTNLNYQTAENITLIFTSGSLDPEISANVAVGAGAANQLVVQTQPSAFATAGIPFAQQPVIQIQDQFGNVCVTNNLTVITATRDAASGSGNLSGNTNVTAVNGIAAFATVAHNFAGTISIDFNSGSLTGAVSSAVSINAANATRLVFSAQPGAAVVGSIFGTQPALVTQDAFGNSSVAGLNSSVPVTLALTAGTGILQGTTNLNIGTAGGNGSISFTDLQIDFAGAKQLTASATGLTNVISTSFTVAQDTQTISFGALSNKIYGDAPFTVSATASSGLPVTFSIFSGPATVASNLVSITGAGGVMVRASQTGDSNYLAATPVNQSMIVAPAVLTITASNASRIFGNTNPVFTAGYSGFVNGDTSGVINGAPAFSTTATTNSNVNGSPYPIIPSAGTLNATNYTFTFVNGQLTLVAATTSLALVSSLNPSLPGSNITFTATLLPVATPAVPTGVVQFQVGGNNFSNAVAVDVNGQGILSAIGSVIGHGNFAITAIYTNMDGNFTGSSDTLSGGQIVNTPPVVGNSVAYQKTPTVGFHVRISEVLTNANVTDADGDVPVIGAVSSPTANGATVTHSGAFIFYTPPTVGANANDSFTYAVSDLFGGTNIGTVNIIVTNSYARPLQQIVSTNGSVTLSFFAIPNYVYVVQRSTNISGIWIDLTTNSAGTNGLFLFSDTNLPSPSGFYRVRTPN